MSRARRTARTGNARGGVRTATVIPMRHYPGHSLAPPRDRRLALRVLARDAWQEASSSCASFAQASSVVFRMAPADRATGPNAGSVVF